MVKMEWLKKLLGDDLFNQVVVKLGDKKIIEDDGKLIPKTRFDEVNTKKSDLEKELNAVKESTANYQKELDALKADKDGGKKTFEEQLTALNKKLADLEAETKSKDEQLQLTHKRSVVESALRAVKANEQYLPTLLREFELNHPLDKIEIVDGKLKDAENLLKPFQETYKPFFGEVKIQGHNPKPGSSTDTGDVYTKEQLQTMSKSEIAANMAKVDRSLSFISNG